MDGADLPQHPPARTVRRKHQIVVVISEMLGARVGRPAGEVGVVGLQELGRHGGGGGDDDVNEAEAEVHERPILAGQGREGVVGDRPQMRQVPNNRPRLWAWREREKVAVAGEQKTVQKGGEDDGDKYENKHFMFEFARSYVLEIIYR